MARKSKADSIVKTSAIVAALLRARAWEPAITALEVLIESAGALRDELARTSAPKDAPEKANAAPGHGPKRRSRKPKK